MQNERIVNKQKIGSSLDLVNHAITKNDTINMTFEVAHRLRNEGYSLIEFLDKFNLKYKFRDDLKWGTAIMIVAAEMYFYANPAEDNRI